MKKVIIYGLGERYRTYGEWLIGETKSEYQVVAVSDKNEYVRGGVSGYSFVKVGELPNVEFDFIIVTSDRYYEEICVELQNNYGIETGKIISMEKIIDEIHRKKFLTDLFVDKYGVEIGGPSSIFKVIYEVCSRCDGINYSADTVWWKNESNQYTYNGQKLGNIIISDVVDLQMIDDDKYDFCISSNNLEHIANPVKALEEQRRILKKRGILVTIVPMKDKCFDHARDYTEFVHLLDDYEKDVSEEDLTHFDEIMAKHDFAMDPACGGQEKFVKRALNNYANRCLHHHVFHIPTLIAMFEYLNIKVVNVGELASNYYIIGEKIDD